jgi:hypothetical protein
MNRRIMAAALIATLALPAMGAGPNARVQFDRNGVTVDGMKPGTKIVWMALTRTRVGHHAELSVTRGMEIATPAGKISIGKKDADTSRSLFAFAAPDDALVTSSIPPGYVISGRPIAARAVAGAQAIVVESPALEIMLVRKQGQAWYLTAVDGGGGDADRLQDTTITVSLQSLQALKGHGQPPKSLSEGDVILMIDPRANRMSTLEVGR